MFSFLRKIRKSLVDSGSVRKYILYSIGEIALVVIGILIALQISNWNEWQKSRTKEKQTLEDVRATILSNNETLSRQIQSISRYTTFGNRVYKWIKGEIHFDSISPQAWQSAMMNGANLKLSTSGYEALKNNGFDLLTNLELKKEVINLFENTYSNLEKEQTWGTVIRPDLDKLLLEHFVKNVDEEGRIVFGLIPREEAFLLESNYYYGLLETAIGQRQFYTTRYERVIDANEKVIDFIDAELAENRHLKNL